MGPGLWRVNRGPPRRPRHHTAVTPWRKQCGRAQKCGRIRSTRCLIHRGKAERSREGYFRYLKKTAVAAAALVVVGVGVAVVVDVVGDFQVAHLKVRVWVRFWGLVV